MLRCEEDMLTSYHDHQFSRPHGLRDRAFRPGEQFECDVQFLPLLNMERYIKARDFAADVDLNDSLTGHKGRLCRSRTEYSDWQDACVEEVGGLLQKDYDRKCRTSISSAKNSGDVESGFHSQS